MFFLAEITQSMMLDVAVNSVAVILSLIVSALRINLSRSSVTIVT